VSGVSRYGRAARTDTNNLKPRWIAAQVAYDVQDFRGFDSIGKMEARVSRRGQAIRLSPRLHVSMAEAGFQSVEETSTRPGKVLAAPIEAATLHLATVAVMGILVSVR
jgi:hypothetical protein